MGIFIVKSLLSLLPITEEVETPMEDKFIELEEQIEVEKEKNKRNRSSTKKCLQEIQETIKNGNGRNKKQETAVAVESASS